MVRFECTYGVCACVCVLTGSTKVISATTGNPCRANESVLHNESAGPLLLNG